MSLSLEAFEKAQGAVGRRRLLAGVVEVDCGVGIFDGAKQARVRQMLPALCEALQGNTTVRTLNLRWNNIGDEGCKALCEGLKGNGTLQTLNLGFNEIGDEGCKALCEVLKDNGTLQTLDLSYNDIGDEGCKALEATLPFLSLKRLRGVDLGSALASNFTLTDCKTTSGARNFLERNKALVEQNAILTLRGASELPADHGHVEVLLVRDLAGTLNLSAAEFPELRAITVWGRPGSEIVLPRAPIEELHMCGAVAVRPPITGLRVMSLAVWDGAVPSVAPGKLPETLERLLVRACGIDDTWLAKAVRAAPRLLFLDIGDNSDLGHALGAVGQLEHLEELQMDGTPFWEAMPGEMREHLQRGDLKRVQQYIVDASVGGLIADWRCKVLLAGYDGVGKTTLADAIVALHGVLTVDGAERTVELRAGVVWWDGKPQASVAGCAIDPETDITQGQDGRWTCTVSMRKMLVGWPSFLMSYVLQSDRHETLREWVSALGRQTAADARVSTVGISIRPWTTESGASVKLWDLSGQHANHDGHQLFLSGGAVYVAVWDMSPGHAQRAGRAHGGRTGALEELGYWLRCIRQQAGEGARLVVVGTHKDTIQDPKDTAGVRGDVVKTKLRASGWDADSIPVLEVGRMDGVDEVRAALETAVSGAIEGKMMPLAYHFVHRALEALAAERETPIVSLSTITERTRQLHEHVDEDVCRRAVQLLHDSGERVYLADTCVIPDPEWLTTSVLGDLKKANAARRELQRQLQGNTQYGALARLSEADLREAWASWSTEHPEWVPPVVELLEERGLLLRDGDGDGTQFVAPMLLDAEPHADVVPLMQPGGTRHVRRVKSPFVPVGTIGRLAKFVQASHALELDHALLWTHGLVVTGQHGTRVVVVVTEDGVTLHGRGQACRAVAMAVAQIVKQALPQTTEYVVCPRCERHRWTPEVAEDPATKTLVCDSSGKSVPVGEVAGEPEMPSDAATLAQINALDLHRTPQEFVVVARGLSWSRLKNVFDVYLLEQPTADPATWRPVDPPYRVKVYRPGLAKALSSASKLFSALATLAAIAGAAVSFGATLGVVPLTLNESVAWYVGKVGEVDTLMLSIEGDRYERSAQTLVQGPPQNHLTPEAVSELLSLIDAPDVRSASGERGQLDNVVVGNPDLPWRGLTRVEDGGRPYYRLASQS